MTNSDIKTDQYDAISVCSICGEETGVPTNKLMQHLLIDLKRDNIDMASLEIHCEKCTNRRKNEN